MVNDRRLTVSTTATLDESLLATGFPYDIRETKDKQPHGVCRVQRAGPRGPGGWAPRCCTWRGSPPVGSNGYWELRLGPWDVAAGSLLVEEAGGRVTNLGGGALDIDAPALVASNGASTRRFLAVLQAIRGPT